MKCSLFNTLLFVLCASFLSACANTPPINSKPFSKNALTTNTKVEEKIKTKLLEHFNNWQGAPHKFGGLSKQGIDCSGFAFVTFRDVFGMKIPRSTELISTTGKMALLNHRKIGDLLIFKTGFRQNHVGIYIGDDKFIHASSSAGVIISDINSPYWSDKYRQIRRVIDL